MGPVMAMVEFGHIAIQIDVTKALCIEPPMVQEGRREGFVTSLKHGPRDVRGGYDQAARPAASRHVENASARRSRCVRAVVR